MIFDVIQQEQVVWSAVYKSDLSLKDLGIAFYHPPMPEIIHWNLFYPSNRKKLLTREEILKINELYESRGIEGNLLDLGQFPSKWAISEEEYFLQPVQFHNPELIGPLSARPAKNIEEFSSTVREIFRLSDAFERDFIAQSSRAEFAGLNVRHFLALCEGEACGTFSLFQTSDEYDFRMNLGLLPKFRGRKLSNCLSALASLQTPRKLMTHTNHIALRRNVLPRTGFRSEGEAFIIPLRKLLKEIKTEQ